MKKQLLPFALIIVIAISLTFIARDLMGETFVAPLLYFLWLGYLAMISIPQQLMWGLFLLAALLISGRSLLRTRRGPRPGSTPQAEETGRIAVWLKLIGQADQETYYKWQLAQRLRRLTLDAVAHDMRLTPKQVRQKLSANQLDLPPDIQAYFQASRTSFSRFSSKRRFRLNKPPASPLDLAPEKIAQFLEERFQL